jgi:hypothetical protein
MDYTHPEVSPTSVQQEGSPSFITDKKSSPSPSPTANTPTFVYLRGVRQYQALESLRAARSHRLATRVQCGWRRSAARRLLRALRQAEGDRQRRDDEFEVSWVLWWQASVGRA